MFINSQELTYHLIHYEHDYGRIKQVRLQKSHEIAFIYLSFSKCGCSHYVSCRGTHSDSDSRIRYERYKINLLGNREFSGALQESASKM